MQHLCVRKSQIVLVCVILGSIGLLNMAWEQSVELEWNTFMGSGDTDWGNGIALDTYRNVFVGGYSYATWGSPVNSHAGGNEAFAAKLDAGIQMGEDADWWVLKKTSDPNPNNWYYFDLPTKSWILGRSPTRQGILFDVSSKKVPKTAGLSPSTYRFYFAIDMAMNGSIDVSQAYYDL